MITELFECDPIDIKFKNNNKKNTKLTYFFLNRYNVLRTYQELKRLHYAIETVHLSGQTTHKCGLLN